MIDGFDARDRLAMQRALELAERGALTTHPNPRVGCVIVHDGLTVGEGWHEWAGEAHAEIGALRLAGSRATGATAYVTLEPCSHHGRTPPCVDALIESRVARVVFAVQDPNPRVSGRGAEQLRAAGIVVDSGLMQREAVELNAGFFMRMRQGRPWVRLKLAMSLDGRTALANGQSQWLTGEAAREDVQHWRARSAALLTGIGTVLADDPRLTVRLPPERARPPLRVVLDSELRISPAARLFESVGAVWVFSASRDEARRASLEARGAHLEHLEVERAAAGTARGLPLHAVLARLAQAEINEVQVEAGATLAGALLRERLVDEMLLYVAPLVLGPQARPLLVIPELTQLAASPRFELLESRSIGADLRLRLRPRAT
jgi:diaminohydroxyphosphoribosylaminopyrimidine deaminase/5-amino-6-(5-phosphoribosylamino)uracil reductase